MSRARTNHRVLGGFLLLIGVGLAVTAEATPGVTAGARAAGGSWVVQTVERPIAPLVATATSGSDPTNAWANVQPGVLKARAASGPAVPEYSGSGAYASSVDHYHLYRPGQPANSSGNFIYHFYLSGTMRLLASTPSTMCSARVSVYGNSEYYGSDSGMLFFEKTPTQAILYAQADPTGTGGSYPMTNMFAGPDGERKIYGTVNAPVGGYYTIHVRLPAVFIFRNLPCNQSPVVDDWYNRIEFGLNCSTSTGASSDFSSTFEFAPQNPIVPDPDDDRLPPDGWTFSTGSDEITLPSPLCVGCATGTGEAFFAVTEGQIANLTALDGSALPAEGRPGVGFGDGFFSFDITGLPVGGSTELTVVMPAVLPFGTNWWYPLASGGWSRIDSGEDDADRWLTFELVDGGHGDGTGADGTIHLAGGLSPSDAQAVWLSAFTAVARGGGAGVDLAWRVEGAEGADAGEFALDARLGARAWAVAVVAQGGGRYAARDENPALGEGGRVLYQLRHDGLVVGTREIDLAPARGHAKLGEVAPNPFNPRTTIAFSAGRTERVRIGVFDLRGRLVALLADREFGPGRHELSWDGRDGCGRAAPAGSYVVRLEAGGRPQSRLVALVR